MKYWMVEECDSGFGEFCETIELGSGPWYYIYKNDEPYLAVKNDEKWGSNAAIFGDYLIMASYNKVHIIDLNNCKIIDAKFESYFDDIYYYFVIDRNMLYALSWHDVMAFTSDLELLWKTDRLSDDGVEFECIDGDNMIVLCYTYARDERFEMRISLLDGGAFE